MKATAKDPRQPDPRRASNRDLENQAVGGVLTLRGFLGKADYERVVR